MALIIKGLYGQDICFCFFIFALEIPPDKKMFSSKIVIKGGFLPIRFIFTADKSISLLAAIKTGTGIPS